MEDHNGEEGNKEPEIKSLAFALYCGYQELLLAMLTVNNLPDMPTCLMQKQ